MLYCDLSIFRMSLRWAGPLTLRRGLVSALLTLVFSVSMISPSAGEHLLIGGTGGALGTLRQLGQAFERSQGEITVEVMPSLGSGGGIKALHAGVIDIAVSVRPLKAKEREALLQEILYAKTALAFVTPNTNPATGLTSRELVRIFEGELTAWPDGQPIGLVIRYRGDSDEKLVIEHIEGMAEAVERAHQRPGVPQANTTQEAADLIASHPGGLGTVPLSVIQGEGRPLKALALDGVAPTPNNLLLGRYPMEQSFYFIVPRNVAPPVRRFLEFVGSNQGRQMLDELGQLGVPFDTP